MMNGMETKPPTHTNTIIKRNGTSNSDCGCGRADGLCEWQMSWWQKLWLALKPKKA
jgi:hypothetical protein